jgi:HEAT repeat protein
LGRDVHTSPFVLRVLTWTAALVLLGIAGIRYSAPTPAEIETERLNLPDTWVDHLYSRNPEDAKAASQWVAENPDDALTVALAVLRDPASGRERKKAALKACGLIGTDAAAAIPDAATLIANTDLAAETAAALSLMGPTAFPPLERALSSDDAVVRREALRGIGKLTGRAPLDPSTVVPLLIDGMGDPDGSVRAVAATYLGILRSGAGNAVPALAAGLGDPFVEVRLASATALEAFGHEARPALPALKKAATDRDRDVAREAGRALVTIAAVR